MEKEKTAVREQLLLNYGTQPPKFAGSYRQKLAKILSSELDFHQQNSTYASHNFHSFPAKFPPHWLGPNIDDLGQKRKKYIGGEAMTNFTYENLPDYAAKKVKDIAQLDPKRGTVLHRYYSEMTRAIKEMYRVLKPGKAAIVVVGSSIMRGQDTETHNCLADIGWEIGFEVPKIGVRKLDRNKRMLPAGITTDTNSQIQQRMHEEYVIGFYKPPTAGEGYQ